MTTSLDEVIEFLDIASSKGFINDNTASARKTACVKFFDILDPDQKNVEYVKDNLEIIKTRFTNLYKDVRGNTVEEYGRRVALVINEFSAWKTDRAAWERDVSARQNSRPTNDGERKAKPRADAKSSTENATPRQDPPSPDTRVVNFPIRPDFDLQIKLPRDQLTLKELKKLGFFLLPYCRDFDPGTPNTGFQLLED